MGSGSTAYSDGHVSQACLLYIEDGSVIVAAGRLWTPRLRKSAKDWTPAYMLQDTESMLKLDEKGCSLLNL